MRTTARPHLFMTTMHTRHKHQHSMHNSCSAAAMHITEQDPSRGRGTWAVRRQPDGAVALVAGPLRAAAAAAAAALAVVAAHE